MEINAEKALLLINQGELLFIVQNNKKTYFAKKKEKIYVQSNAYSFNQMRIHICLTLTLFSLYIKTFHFILKILATSLSIAKSIKPTIHFKNGNINRRYLNTFFLLRTGIVYKGSQHR